MKLKYILAAFLLSLGGPLSAQNKYDFGQFWTESGVFLTQPARWGGKDWLTLGGAGAATLAVGHYDEAIQDGALKHRNYAKKLPVEIGEQWGGFFVTPVVAISLITQGWTAGNEATKKMGFEIAQAAIYASIISDVMKNAFGRARPKLRRGTGSYKPFDLNSYSYNSFPAGHVDAAVSLSTILARSTDSVPLKVLAYVPAGLTVASRIYRNQHWASDCVFGAAIGYFTADWVLARHEKKPGASAAAANFYPYLAGDAVGIGLSMKL